VFVDVAFVDVMQMPIMEIAGVAFMLYDGMAAIWGVKSDLLMEIFRVFREKKITLPYPVSNPPGKPTQTVAIEQSAA